VSPIGRNNQEAGLSGPEGRDGQESGRLGKARPKDKGCAPARKVGTTGSPDDAAMAGASRVVTLTNRYGLHMRPAHVVVELANSFPCDIDLIVNGRAVDAKSILALIGLEAACGDEVLIEARGERADEAIAEVGDLLASLPEFDEAARRQTKEAGPSDTVTGRKRSGTSGRSVPESRDGQRPGRRGPGVPGKRRPGRTGGRSGAGRSASAP
jgi:phosphotransferase system HPr (HPr) family protein